MMNAKAAKLVAIAILLAVPLTMTSGAERGGKTR